MLYAFLQVVHDFVYIALAKRWAELTALSTACCHSYHSSHGVVRHFSLTKKNHFVSKNGAFDRFFSSILAAGSSPTSARSTPWVSGLCPNYSYLVILQFWFVRRANDRFQPNLVQNFGCF
jgi:hypothetical protein